MFKVLKREKCIKKGVTIGGKNMDEYMLQLINPFKEIYYNEKSFIVFDNFSYSNFNFCLRLQTKLKNSAFVLYDRKSIKIKSGMKIDETGKKIIINGIIVE